MITENPKKHGFLGRIPRLFTIKDRDVYADIHFQEPEHTGDETQPALECPELWNAEAASVLAGDALCRSIPAHTRAIEENTIPSWLWRRTGQGAGRTEEFSARQIFDRVAGSAAYVGWKQGLFSDEGEARVFYDEIRLILMQRLIAVEPGTLAALGLDWAYGIEDRLVSERPPIQETAMRSVDIPNTMIDAIVGGVVSDKAGKTLHAKRQKLWSSRTETSFVTLRFSDIAADWGTLPQPGVCVTLDLMGFRHNDGWVNIDALRHAVRLTVLLLDLHGDRIGSRLEIGFSNFAPLLMALALPYDSNSGRSVAAALSAIMTAEAYATSAELAGSRGPGADYIAARETTLRALRNHRRAAYGDRNDYEKISVLPAPLMLEHSPDLALVAVAQRRWEDVLSLARKYGLRHTQVTALTSSARLMLFTESVTQGTAPVTSLTHIRTIGTDLFEQKINSSVAEALTRLGYDHAASRAITRYIAGAATLEKAPGVNHVALRERGFNEAAIARVEDYLRYVNDIRLAFTQWIVGEEFCRKTLKVSATKLQNRRFDLLNHLGFSAMDIDVANAFCYGHGSVRGAKDIRQQHAPIFARAIEILPEARIRMASAVQGFISGDAGLKVSLPLGSTAEKNESLLLSAWRQGVKSIAIIYDAAPAVIKSKAEASAVETKRLANKVSGKIRPSVFLHSKQPAPLPMRRLHPKAGSSLVSLGRGKGKSSPATRGKRG